MKATLILWPMLVQIFLTIVVFILLAARKIKAVKSGFDRNKAALDNNAWPDYVRQVSNNLQNQFQTPVLFYVLSLVFLQTNSVTVLVLVLSWIYVASRMIHSYIHTTSNYVPMRFRSFLVGCLALMALACVLALQLAVPGIFT